MLVEISHLSKSIGAKDLFTDLTCTVTIGEKIALIGRNGLGKTTLLKLLSGEDTDFHGTIKTKKNLHVVLTKQEHHGDNKQTVIEYILQAVPLYLSDKKILEDFEQGIHHSLHTYTDAVERFSSRGYFHLEDKIINTLQSFQINQEKVYKPLQALSGGEKRYVELTKLMFSEADLFLIDEPTNHMDYQGKEQFIKWMDEEQNSMIIVTHDRDVLHHATKIFELKDQSIKIYPGNYDYYLTQNTTHTTHAVKQYADQLNKLKEAKKRVEWGLKQRAKSKEWKIRYDHWLRDYEKIKAETVKPSFWIDQESVEELDTTVTDSYHKFKEKNISINLGKQKDSLDHLLTVHDLSLGYSEPLFKNLTFTLRKNNRVFIKGRNGAGKSTLVKTILSQIRGQTVEARQFQGEIITSSGLRIGEYQQEIPHSYLSLTLCDAIMTAYHEENLPLPADQLNSLLAQYLFNPIIEGNQKIANLSGGQKARFQIIKMLVSQPNLVILDEPTNHLDLPSIEELENALLSFQGGILYISHDTYFINKLGGEILHI